MSYWDWYPRYPKTKPREVKGGIKAKAKGKIGGETWWATRWINVLESFGWSNRLPRGRSYARRGQVIEYEIDPGQITAKVQGSRPKPYSVKIGVQPLSPTDWNKVADAMVEQAIFTAKLLAGEMPHEIEDAFKAAKASLFPASARELEMSCSCPDWAVPCKHIAAVYYIVGEAFDRDPFLMFHLRGRSREELLAVLHQKRAEQGELPETAELPPDEAEEKIELTPLAAGPEKFWGSEKGLDAFQVSIAPPAVRAPILRRLGALPAWEEREDCFKFMDRIYSEVSRVAVDLAYRSETSNQGKSYEGRDQ
jgi:uncharacterized Zn finger protein